MHPPDRLDCVCSALHSYRAAVRTRTIRKANLIVNAQAPVAAIIKSLHTMLVLQHVLTPNTAWCGGRSSATLVVRGVRTSAR